MRGGRRGLARAVELDADPQVPGDLPQLMQIGDIVRHWVGRSPRLAAFAAFSTLASLTPLPAFAAFRGTGGAVGAALPAAGLGELGLMRAGLLRGDRLFARLGRVGENGALGGEHEGAQAEPESGGSGGHDVILRSLLDIAQPGSAALLDRPGAVL
jgi:hypothetical protein